MKSRRFMPPKYGSLNISASHIICGMITLLAFVAMVAGVQDSALAVIPRPVHMTRGTGTFALSARTVIVTDRATRDIGYQLADWLQPATGYRLSVGAAGAGGSARTISLGIDPTLSRLGEEGYRLSVAPAVARRRPACVCGHDAVGLR